MGRPIPGWMGVRVFAASLSLVSFGSSAVGAQEPGPDTTTFRVTLHLRDVDSNGPLMGALIEVSGQSRRYVTGVGGQVSLQIRAGQYALTANKGGYATLRGTFRVTREGDLRVTMRELGDVETGIPARLLVRVSEFGSGRLLDGASVSVDGEQSLLSDGQGWAEFWDPRGPVAEVTVEGFGYEARTEPVALQEGRTTVVEVAMAIDALVLAPLEVEAKSGFLAKQGVYWRVERGWQDKLMTREELIELGNPRLSDAFRKLPGVMVSFRGPVIILTTYGGCPIPVFMDGMPLGMDAVGLSLNDISPEELELAEVYEPGRAPALFLGKESPCGAILLWSRERAGTG